MHSGDPDRSPPQGIRSWRALGTTVEVVVTVASCLDEASRLLDDELSAIDRVASRFRLDSELSMLNQSPDRVVAISPLLAEALATALRAAEVTSGMVDPTVGEALIAAGYDRDFALMDLDGPPLTDAAQPASGWRGIVLDARACRVRVPARTRLDLGATAKALAADRAAHAIARATGSGVLISLGGDVATAGPAPSQGWVIGMPKPDPSVRGCGPSGATGHSSASGGITISGGGIATSGTTLRRWRRGGRHLHHIIDPATGLPAESCWHTVTVAAGTCVDANIAATAAILLGREAPRWLSDRALPARLLDGNGGVVTTPGWPADDRDGPPAAAQIDPAA